MLSGDKSAAKDRVPPAMQHRRGWYSQSLQQAQQVVQDVASTMGWEVGQMPIIPEDCLRQQAQGHWRGTSCTSLASMALSAASCRRSRSSSSLSAGLAALRSAISLIRFISSIKPSKPALLSPALHKCSRYVVALGDPLSLCAIRTSLLDACCAWMLS